jgi:formylglycine-generating enzyme required for sulfatase activity
MKINVKCKIQNVKLKIVGMTLLILLCIGYELSAMSYQQIGGGADGTGMVFIPEGEFIMGSDDDDIKEVKKIYGNKGGMEGYLYESEKPKRKVYVKSFFIDKYEVTNAQYKKFIDATGYPPPRHWSNGMYPSGKAHYPVLFISWYDAKEYAKWAGKRLPTEEEWEKAARGKDGRIYPWGGKYDPVLTSTAEAILENILEAICNVNTGNPVGTASGDLSPYGVHDMGGNVREWTDSWFSSGKEKKVVKGGSWVDLSPKARCASKDGIALKAVSHIIGFRCVKDYEMTARISDQWSVMSD